MIEKANGNYTDTDVLHVGKPNVGDRALFDQLVDEMFQRQWFTNNGCLVQELESRIAEFLGVKHCIAVCNATVGLQLACHALDLAGEVILPAFTFVATAHAVQWERLTPVFVDIDPTTHAIDIDSIETAITDRTSAIIGVHTWGVACNVDKIQQLAERYGLVTIFDAAHAFGCGYAGKMIGNFGDCEVFSFHATKFFNTFEGGAITTNDDALAEKLRLMKNFGFASMDQVIHLGTNGKMSEIHAAMGIANLSCIQEIIDHNQRNYQIYQSLLSDVPGVCVFEYDQQTPSNFQYVVIEIEHSRFGMNRDQLLQNLMSSGIRARRYFYPGCHRMEPYSTLYPRQRERLPKTDWLCERVLCLPNGKSIGEKDIERIGNVILSAANPSIAAA